MLQRDHGIRYANARPAVLPSELRGTVGTVSGLNNLIVAKPLSNVARRRSIPMRRRLPRAPACATRC